MSWNPWEPTAPMGPSAPAPRRAPAAPQWPTPQPAPIVDDTTTTLPVGQRRWVAALALYLLASLIAEGLTGSTPPLNFFNPLTLLFLTALYGSGALLVRETARRRALGWGSVVLLGAAYGVLEEGLVVTSWFNPHWPDAVYLASFTHILGVNWFWAVGLTAFHAIVSVTLPITLVEAAFPTLAPLPWFSRRGYHLLMLLLGITSVVGLVAFGFLMFRAQGYHPPLLGWLLTLAIAVALVWLATHPLARLWRQRRGAPATPPRVSQRPAPSLPSLRFAGFFYTIAFFVILWGGPNIFHRQSLALALLILTIALGVWTVSRWSRRIDWSAQQRLALLTGVALFWVALAPLMEYSIHPAGKDETGITLLAAAMLVALIWLARMARKTEERRLGQR